MANFANFAATVEERLRDTAVQDGVAQVFIRYYCDLQEILTAATVESGGVRPKGLENEIYSCFHHMARGLCEPDIDPDSEFRMAANSHLKRATLDSYKIVINSYLAEEKRMRDILDYMVLVEDFTKFVPDGLAMVNKVKEGAQAVKKHYSAAKRAEILGSSDDAIRSFNQALEECVKLRGNINVFTADRSYILACAREAKKGRDKAKDRRFTLLSVFVSALLAAVLTAVASYYVPRILGAGNTDKDHVQFSDHIAPTTPQQP